MRVTKLPGMLVFSLLCACKGAPERSPSGPASASASVAPPAAASVATTEAPPALLDRDADHVGGVIARVAGGDGVLIADEDHGLLRHIADTSPLTHPGDATVAQETLAMGGAPANLVAIRDGALVTVRDPGKLVRVRRGADGKLSVAHELAVAADAWGIAVNDAGTRALVTSAWTSTVTLVDISDAGLKKCAEVTVGREPRGVAFASETVAYVNHLVGNEITKLSLRTGCDANSLGEPKPIVVPPSPVRSPAGKVLPASMGYSLALSPDRKRLFLPRHALGARSHASWFGSTTVDALLLPSETPAAPMHTADLPGLSSKKVSLYGGDPIEFDNQPVEAWSAFIQPRDIRYRRATSTVVVVSEGADRLVELDAMAMDPAYALAGLYELSDSVRRAKEPSLKAGHWPQGSRRDAYADPSDANASDDKSCAAPQGVVLDAREEAAFVFCRASTTLARVELGKKLDSGANNHQGLSYASLGSDAGGKESLNLGRRLFYSAVMAEGMGCAGCHPEGRDDGHVWRETDRQDVHARRFLGGAEILGPTKAPSGVPRRTPMLVGRVFPVGPYGWRGESETLEKRIEAGIQLHAGEKPPKVPAYYINALAVFLRKGLVKPPAHTGGLTPEEQKGKAVFEDAKSGCTVCHEPARYLSNYMPMKLSPLPTQPGFLPEEDALYKTPSLLHVGHHGSLFHDGSMKTLEELIDKNGTRMGDTAHLGPEERKALVAYLKTL